MSLTICENVRPLQTTCTLSRVPQRPSCLLGITSRTDPQAGVNLVAASRSTPDLIGGISTRDIAPLHDGRLNAAWSRICPARRTRSSHAAASARLRRPQRPRLRHRRRPETGTTLAASQQRRWRPRRPTPCPAATPCTLVSHCTGSVGVYGGSWLNRPPLGLIWA